MMELRFCHFSRQAQPLASQREVYHRAPLPDIDTNFSDYDMLDSKLQKRAAASKLNCILGPGLQQANVALHHHAIAHLTRNYTTFTSQATQDAPTLWERHDAELRKETTKRVALRQVAERVFGTGHGNWDRKTDAEKIFDEEERAMLRLPT